MTKTPSPRKKETPTARVRQFFVDHPGVELTYSDLAAKFGVQEQFLYSLIGRLKSQGVVTVEHVVRGLRAGEKA